MRRVLIAVVFITLLGLPGVISPAQAAAPLACVTDVAGDVMAYAQDVPQGTTPAPKADLRRFCASAGLRIGVRFRIPGVDPTTDTAWVNEDASAAAIFDAEDDGINDYILRVLGPYTDSHFFLQLLERDGDVFVDAECSNVASSYDAVNKVILASIPASCFGGMNEFRAIGRSFRDPTPASVRSYLLDDSNEIIYPPPV
jgi:hypothetical protein